MIKIDHDVPIPEEFINSRQEQRRKLRSILLRLCLDSPGASVLIPWDKIPPKRWWERNNSISFYNPTTAKIRGKAEEAGLRVWLLD